MSRRGENIYKRKDGRWEGRFISSYDANGKAIYKYVYEKNYADVKRKMLILNIDNTNNNENLSDIKFKNYSYWLNKWIENKKVQIKYSTYVLYKNFIENHITPFLGKYQVNKISTALLDSYIKNLLTVGRIDRCGGLSAKTVSDILAVIKETFKFIKSYGVPVICDLSSIVVRKKPKKIRVLNNIEQKKLMNYLTNKMDLCKAGFLICLYTGIRLGELCALKWKNISLKDKTLKIEHTMQRIQNKDAITQQKTQIIITTPKSFSSIRTIPMPNFLIRFLQSFENNPNAFFLSGKCQTYVEPRTMQNRFKKYIRECNIDDANCHCLRHTFCSNCIELGFDLKTLSEILGHSSVKTTLDKYAHSSMQLKIQNMEKLSMD